MTKPESEGQKRGPGRPPRERSDAEADQVARMVRAGIRREDIAKVLEMSENTLRKLYREELDRADKEQICEVAESLVQQALGDGPGSVTAKIFYLKCRAGWRESQTIEVTGDGGPAGLVVQFAEAVRPKDAPKTIEHPRPVGSASQDMSSAADDDPDTDDPTEE